jgi:hypothetical protein
LTWMMFHGLTELQKLVVLGGTVETARRVSASAWNNFVDCTLSHFVICPTLIKCS